MSAPDCSKKEKSAGWKRFLLLDRSFLLAQLGLVPSAEPSYITTLQLFFSIMNHYVWEHPDTEPHVYPLSSPSHASGSLVRSSGGCLWNVFSSNTEQSF